MQHMLPQCSIDMRIAFHGPPVKLQMVDTRFQALKWVLRRREVDSTHLQGQQHYRIPVWQSGEDRYDLSRPCPTTMYVCYNFLVCPSIAQIVHPPSLDVLRSIRDSTVIEVLKVHTSTLGKCTRMHLASVHIAADGSHKTTEYHRVQCTVPSASTDSRMAI